MTSTSRKLTDTLKQARKAKYFTDMHDIATFAFAWQWPHHVDWDMTDTRARELYDDAQMLMDSMAEEGKTLTACQRHMLAD